MRITDQDVPPGLVEIYDELISSNTAGEYAGTSARTRRGARLPASRDTPSENAQYLIKAVEALIKKWKKRLSPAAISGFRSARLDELKDGIFNPEYWTACPRTSEIYYSSVPTSEPDPAPPPYAYRTESNLPSLPEYPEGTPGSGPLQCTGETTAGYFNDTLWCWKRSNYDLIREIESTTDEPVLLAISASVSINTDARGSRPMLSMLIAPKLCPSGAAILESAAPPIAGARSIYWRYRIPETSPPYFSLQENRNVVVALGPSALQSTSPPAEKCTVASGMRPMFGRGFNNCEEVNIEATTEENIYMVELPPPGEGLPCFKLAAGQWRSIEIETGATEVTDGQPDPSNSFYGANTICRYAAGNNLEILNNDLTIRTTVPQPYGSAYALGNMTPCPEGWIVTWQRPSLSYPIMVARISRAGAIIESIPQQQATVPEWVVLYRWLLGPQNWFCQRPSYFNANPTANAYNSGLNIYRHFITPTDGIDAVCNAYGIWQMGEDYSVTFLSWSELAGDTAISNTGIEAHQVLEPSASPRVIWALDDSAYITQGTSYAWRIYPSGVKIDLPPCEHHATADKLTAGLWPMKHN